MMAFVTKAAAPEPSPEPATSKLPAPSVEEAVAADEPAAEIIAPAAGGEAGAAEPAPEDGAAAAEDGAAAPDGEEAPAAGGEGDGGEAAAAGDDGGEAAAPPPPAWSRGDVVWAKVTGFPWWPGQVRRVRAGGLKVLFFGTRDYTVVKPMSDAGKPQVLYFGDAMEHAEKKGKQFRTPALFKKFKAGLAEAADAGPCSSDDEEETGKEAREAAEIAAATARDPKPLKKRPADELGADSPPRVVLARVGDATVRTTVYRSKRSLGAALGAAAPSWREILNEGDVVYQVDAAADGGGGGAAAAPAAPPPPKPANPFAAAAAASSAAAAAPAAAAPASPAGGGAAPIVFYAHQKPSKTWLEVRQLRTSRAVHVRRLKEKLGEVPPHLLAIQV